MLPETETTEPVMLVAETLPPVTLPVAEIDPGVAKFAPAMLPVTFSADTTFELRLNPEAFKFPPVILPLVLMVFDPKLAKNVATLALPYTAGVPVAKALLPKI
jgi:hypothetical protein